MDKSCLNFSAFGFASNPTMGDSQYTHPNSTKRSASSINLKLISSARNAHTPNNPIMEISDPDFKGNKEHFDRKSVQMKKVLDEHKVLFESIKLVEGEKK